MGSLCPWKDSTLRRWAPAVRFVPELLAPAGAHCWVEGKERGEKVANQVRSRSTASFFSLPLPPPRHSPGSHHALTRSPPALLSFSSCQAEGGGGGGGGRKSQRPVRAAAALHSSTNAMDCCSSPLFSSFSRRNLPPIPGRKRTGSAAGRAKQPHVRKVGHILRPPLSSAHTSLARSLV